MGITVAENGFPQVCSADSEGWDFPSRKDGPPYLHCQTFPFYL